MLLSVINNYMRKWLVIAQGKAKCNFSIMIPNSLEKACNHMIEQCWCYCEFCMHIIISTRDATSDN